VSTATQPAVSRERVTYELRRADAALRLDYIRRGTPWIPAPLWWATHCTETFDEHWEAKGLAGPYRPFPGFSYMPWAFNLMLTRRRLFFPKSREMVMSWAVLAYLTWKCQLFPRTRAMVQCQKLEKACELVKGTEPPGYARTLWERQPREIREAFPLSARMEDLPADKLSFKNGSVIMAVGKGADQVRSYHPTIYVMDEAAHMDEAEASFGAASPVADQIIAVSSAAGGWFADTCSKE
jgi:hypothetical protein